MRLRDVLSHDTSTVRGLGSGLWGLDYIITTSRSKMLTVARESKFQTSTWFDIFASRVILLVQACASALYAAKL